MSSMYGEDPDCWEPVAPRDEEKCGKLKAVRRVPSLEERIERLEQLIVDMDDEAHNYWLKPPIAEFAKLIRKERKDR